ncbi:glycosyltransferase family 2 protein [Flavobacterium sp. J49]|uniref:glycosyltransferase family 2 protein n=1 Tax=Flavobacterium sp. J49 TaxID=2718534 RepID=UPI0015945198|nr:glycosyltransferase family 2 protein [Flavobacterium sp. J49]MBF6641462.1 glycosyltransferase family 2 protein [Flavobacterium sp. J49]NIC02709.1 glycosyltransferase family 2 protein [Flavobacterium sp. J49]
MTRFDISIIVPLYNEEKVFEQLVQRITNVINATQFSCEVILINDGSTDDTEKLIEKTCKADSRFTGIILSRNHGHQLAVSAGLMNVRGGKGAMIIDGDLQDPPELVNEFYALLSDGYDVIYAIRKNRKEGFLKKLAYSTYYRLQKKISSFNIPIDSGDFSMLSRRVVDTMNAMPEQSRYLRGMRAWVGFKQIGYEYNRDERQAGETKYSWTKLFELAFNGIFNFSDFPVKIITRLGFITVVFSLIYFAYNLYRKFYYNDVPQGFTATILAIILFSGVQMISLGLIGEYVLRIYNQVRNRPLFVIDKLIQDQEEKPLGK